ncbi:MAG: TIR domain-containing protein [Arenimonas sp.]|nr:TIR domain-containing protein [Arenimonas sp.]
MNTPGTYRAFISYSHRDKAWADWLHRSLETYRLPATLVGRDTPFGPIPARLAPIFRDRDELSAATDLSAEINAALRGSMFLVVICSPAAAASRWVNEEIIAFKRLHGDDRVRAIIVDGEPFSGNPATECFPAALRHRFNAAGEMTTEPAEPIAADARTQGDGKKFAISKLVAGLTGARLDELIQREQQRRNARMGALALGLGALVLVLSGLTWDALRQRNAARAAQAEAQFQRDEAQSLVEFMLTDLRQRLDAVGRLDVLEAVGTRLSESYVKQDLAKLDPDALGRRARVQLLLGEIDSSRGNLDTALAQYQQAAATTAELLQRDPGDAQRIYDHAQSVFWVGQIAWQRGDAKVAQSQFQQYHDYARQLVASDPTSDDWQMELNYGLSNLGTLAMDQGDAAAAERHFHEALRVAMALLEESPEDAERLVSAGNSLAWLADALVRQTKLAEARQIRGDEIALYERWLTQHPEDAVAKGFLATARFRLAQTQLNLGLAEDALDNARRSAVIAEALLAAEGDNVENVDRAVYAGATVGEVYLHLGQYLLAEDALRQAIAAVEQFIARKPDPVQSRGLTASKPMLLLAELHARQGDRAQAHRLFNQVVAQTRERVDGGEATDAVTLRSHCFALAGVARMTPSSDTGWTEIITLLGAARVQLGPDAQTVLAEAYAHSGQTAAARAIATQLHAAGYRHPNFMALLGRFPNLLALPE